MKQFHLLKKLSVCSIITTAILFFNQDAGAQTLRYVNDASTVGDGYTSAPGSVGGTGTASSPYLTLAQAMTASVAGDVILMDAGSYSIAAITVKAGVKVIGLCPASTILICQNTASGTITMASNTELSKVTVTRQAPTVASGQTSVSLATTSGGNNIKISNNLFLKNRTGIYINSTTASPGVTIENNDFDDNRTGIIGADATYANILIRGNNILNSRSYGIIFTGANSLANVKIENNNITGNLASQVDINGLAASGVTLANNWFGTAAPVIYAGNTNSGFSVDDHNVVTAYPYGFTDANGAALPNYPNDISGTATGSITVGSHAASAIPFSLPGCCVVTSNSPAGGYPSIQSAINASNPGATITLCAGQTYNEQVLVNKSVIIQGNGATVNFSGTVSGKPTLFDVSGNPVTINNIHFMVDLSKLRSAIIASSSVIEDITVTNNVIDCYGVAAGSYGDRNAVSINYSGSTNYRVAAGGVNNIVFSGNIVNFGVASGFRSAISADEAGGTFSNNTLSSINHDILLRFGSNGAVSISGNQFNGGGVELAEFNASGGPITVYNNNFDGTNANNLAPNTAVLRLKNNQQDIYTNVSGNIFVNAEWGISMENYRNVNIQNSEFTPLPGSTTYHHVTVNTKSISTNSSSIVQTQIGALIINNIFNGGGSGGGTAIGFYNHDADAASFGSFDVHENSFDIDIANDIYEDMQAGASTGSSVFGYNGNIGMGAGAITTMAPWTASINGTCNWYGTTNGATIAGKVGPHVSHVTWLTNGTDNNAATGFQPVPNSCGGCPSGNVIQNLNTLQYFCTIQDAVTAASPGHTISVGPGNYYEDVVVNKQLTISGAGYATTTVSGPIGGPGATFQVTAAGVVIEGFTITRDGNNPAQWNLALNSAGIAVQGQGINAEIRNNKFVGNRTGIDINNSNGNNIHNNIIDDNRTGVIFRNQTDNTNFQNNFVTNNWTVGVLFLDGSGGTNVPPQSAANSTFNNNNISGNWYGGVVDRQSGGSIPAPGTNLKDFTCNWWGATPPSTSTANSAEPGYAAQIPVAYGGAATAPGGQPDIAGPASANITHVPYLLSGTDNDAAIGFQLVPGSCGGGVPKLSTVINSVTVNANNDGNDDMGSFSVCPGSPNIFFGPFTDQNGLSDPLLKVKQVITTVNVTVPFCLNCQGAMSIFNGATGTAALIDPSQAGTLTMRFKSWIDANNDNQVDPGEYASDWIQYDIAMNPLPILRQTYNGVQVTANNDGTDDTGSFTVCSSNSDNVFLTEITDLHNIVPPAKVKVEQVIVKTNVTMPTAADGIYTLSSIGPIPLGRTATLINPAMSGTVQIKRRAFYDANSNFSIDPGECVGDWIVYNILVDGDAPAFTVPADITIPYSGTCGYNAAPGVTGNPSNISDNGGGSVTVTYTDVVTQCGNSLVITRTWKAEDGCGNYSTQDQTITVTDNNTTYIIYATKEAKFGESNTIHGDVGVTDANGKAEFKKNDQLDPYHVYAKHINVQSPALVSNKHFVPAAGGPAPAFYAYSGGGLSGNYTQSVSGVVPAGNYKNLTIRKGVTATVNGNNYGKVSIEEGANVTFTSSSINMEELTVGKGKGNSTTNVYFNQCTGIMVKDRVTIEEDTRVNVGGPKVNVYLGDAKKDEENFTVKGDDAQVTMNIMIPNGKLKVNGGNSNAIMTGYFIVEKLESDGKNVEWRPYTCLPYAKGPLVTSVESRNTVIEKADVFSVKVFPNPSYTDFRLQVLSPSDEPVSIRITDVLGRTMKVISESKPNVLVTVGTQLRNGVYFAEVRQGLSKQTVRLVKLD